MSSREKILSTVKASQPELILLPDIDFLKGDGINVAEKFITTLTTIGGKAIRVNSFEEIVPHIQSTVQAGQRVVSNLSELSAVTESIAHPDHAPHLLQDVELAVMQGYIGVAENGAVWLKNDGVSQRVIPFICQHLALVISKDNIVPTMHEAYNRIGNAEYGFATFIAGPSKTADIEQSLVLGAHGSRSMTVFIME